MIITLRAAMVSAALLAALTGCTKEKAEPVPNGTGQTFLPGPPIDQVATRYNANAQALRQLFAPVVVRLQYTDSKDQTRNEQGEGRLQLIQPDHVALTVGKIGETYFWLGSDSQRYWWADRTAKPTAFFVGTHGRYEQSQARRLGVVVAPLDLVRLLGITPLAGNATTQFSSDRQRIGVSTSLNSGSIIRTWIDAATYSPVSIEIFSPTGELQIRSVLANPDGVTLKGTAVKPIMNKRAIITHLASNSTITLDLSDVTDGAGRMVPDTFDPEAVARYLRADTYVDLDAPPPPRANSTAGTTARP